MKPILAASCCALICGFAQADQAQWDYTESVKGTETSLAPDSLPVSSGLATYITTDVMGTYNASLTVNGSGSDLAITAYNVSFSLTNGEIYSVIAGGLLYHTYQTGAVTCGFESFGISGCLNFAGADSKINLTVVSAQQGYTLGVDVGGGADGIGFTSPRGCTTLPYSDSTNANRLCELSLSGAGSKWVEATHAPEMDSASAGGALALLGGLVFVVAGRRRTLQR